MSGDLLAVLRRIANSSESASSYNEINEIHEKTQPKGVATQPLMRVSSLNSFISSPDTQTKSSTDWRDLFEERAAIREFDGGHTRAEAERLAWGDLENRWNLEHGERAPRHLCAGCRRPIGDTKVLDLIDGNRVHFADNDCLVRHGNRWRSAATSALLALGLAPPERPDFYV